MQMNHVAPLVSATLLSDNVCLLQDEIGSVALLQYSPSSHPLKHSFLEPKGEKGNPLTTC